MPKQELSLASELAQRLRVAIRAAQENQGRQRLEAVAQGEVAAQEIRSNPEIRRLCPPRHADWRNLKKLEELLRALRTKGKLEANGAGPAPAQSTPADHVP